MNRVLAPFNARLVGIGSTPSWEYLFKTLQRYHFDPKTIFDIGVAYGTPWLYEAFPHAFYYLIDPLKESLPHMQRIQKQIQATILNVALGTSVGEVEIEAHVNIGGSTIFAQEGKSDTPVLSRYQVPRVRLDSLVKPSSILAPALCKIDVQGAELDVLGGMSGMIDALDVIIVECQTIATLQGAPEVASVIALMARFDFCLYDVVAVNRRPLDGATAQVDLAFVKEDGMFRKDHRWR